MLQRLSLKNIVILAALLSLFPFVTAHATQKTILIVGDSLSAGYGLSTDDDWPTLLQHQLKQTAFKEYRITNVSISGETTHGGRARLPKLLDTHQPAVVIIALGANDGLQGQSLKRMKANLTSMIEAAKAHGAKVLIAGMQIPPNFGRRYTRQFQQVFTDVTTPSNTALIPFLLEGVAAHDHLFQKDRLHPTSEAQPIIANLVSEYLVPLLRSKE